MKNDMVIPIAIIKPIKRKIRTNKKTKINTLYTIVESEFFKKFKEEFKKENYEK